MPIFSNNIVGSLFCEASVEGRPAQAVADSGNTLTFLSQCFVDKCRFPVFSCVGPLVTVVSGETFECRLCAK
jgi:hypothetical protein